MQDVIFQEYMPENVCFGCGHQNVDGLKIASHWEGEKSICIWQPDPKYCGWPGLLNGGIMATLIDCHCMGTAMADAYRSENRDLDSQPIYRYATGTLTVRYLKPTPLQRSVKLVATILERKGRKSTIQCDLYSGELKTAEATVIAIRVYDSSSDENSEAFS